MLLLTAIIFFALAAIMFGFERAWPLMLIAAGLVLWLIVEHPLNF